MGFEKKHDKFDKILNLIKVLGEISDYEESLKIISNSITEIFTPCESTIIMINPRTMNTIKTIYSDKNDNSFKLLHNTVSGWIIKKERSFSSSENAELLNILPSQSQISVIASPLRNSGRIIGIVLLINKKVSFSSQDKNFLEIFSTLISPFISNTQNIYKYFSPPLEDGALIQKFNEFGLIGKCSKFIELLKTIEIASKSCVRVFIQGKSGTGKELVAKSIHKLSDRLENKFVAIDCGAIPTHLIEGELFGHVKGAFTGAESNRIGLLEEANGGTLFMDEITNLPIEIQSKLLRVLQENEIRPLGSNRTKKIDVRIITASSSSITDVVNAGKFREDLFYRIFVYPIYVPTLSERAEDIPELSNHFMKKYCNQQNKKQIQINDDAMAALINHNWKGNIRELENYIERVVSVSSHDKMTISISDLPREITEEYFLSPLIKQEGTLPKLLESFERDVIDKELKNSNWNQSEAARNLGIPEQTLRYKMKKLKIEKSIFDYS